MPGAPELRVDEGALYGNPAEVAVRQPPVVTAGSDTMRLMIATIKPNMADEIVERVARTRVREQRFADNLIAARRAYIRSDAEGQQNICSANEVRPTSTAFSASPLVGSRAHAGEIGQFEQILGTPYNSRRPWGRCRRVR